MPPFFTEFALQKLRDLASLVDESGQDVEGVNLKFGDASPVALSATAIAHVDNLLEANVKSLGSVEGRLQTLSDRRGFKFFVYEDLTDRRIECFFDEEMADEVERAWRRRVSVYGLISYRRTGTPINIHVESLRVLGGKPLPTWSDVKGILAG